MLSITLSFFSLSLSYAQVPSETAQLQANTQFNAGWTAYESGDFAVAVSHFEKVFVIDPLHRINGKPPTAFYFGLALKGTQQDQKAHQVWQAAMGRFRLANTVDVNIWDAYLQGIFNSGFSKHYALASEAYIEILGLTPDGLSPDERRIHTRHIMQALPLLPDAFCDRLLVQGTCYEAKDVALKDEARHNLTSWWRSQDPFPATAHNERIVEHLIRVHHALAHFGYESNLRGYDDRGEIYVRLGPPATVDKISFGKVLDYSFIRYSSVLPSDIRESEAWTYLNLSSDAFFLFVNRQGRYRLSQVYDLLPQRLRSGAFMTGTVSDSVQARAFIEIMTDVYKQLSRIHHDFMGQYIGLEEYVLDGYSRNRDPARLQNLYRYKGRPNVFAMSKMRQGQQEDAMMLKRRQENVPKQYTEVYENLETLDIALRYGRFLDPDGSTRIEFAWGHLPGTLDFPFLTQGDSALVTAETLIQVTAMQHTQEYAPYKKTQYRYEAETLSENAVAALPVHTLVLENHRDQASVHLQWDQHALRSTASESTPTVGERFRMNFIKVDSLPALIGEPGTLEMSDLVPVFIPHDVSDHELSRYPFYTLSQTIPIGIYFEVYNLTFDSNDVTRYKVEYEISRLTEGALLSFLGNKRNQVTAASAIYSGTSRLGREYITLDLSEWGGKGLLSLKLALTDLNTDRSINRTIQFEFDSAK